MTLYARYSARYGDNQLKRLEEISARAKDIDEGITEFKRYQEEQHSETLQNGNGQHMVVQSEGELCVGWRTAGNLRGL